MIINTLTVEMMVGWMGTPMVEWSADLMVGMKAEQKVVERVAYLVDL